MALQLCRRVYRAACCACSVLSVPAHRQAGQLSITEDELLEICTDMGIPSWPGAGADDSAAVTRQM